VALLHGSFLIAQSEGQSIELEYSIDDMRQDLLDIKRYLDKYLLAKEKDVTPFYYETLVELQQLNANLLNLLEQGATPEQPVLLKLDKNTAQPYRILLYDCKQGLFKTQEEQKNFFLSVLENLPRASSEGTLIEKYGKPFNCALCHCETHSVDTLLMRAFCDEMCRSQYSATC